MHEFRFERVHGSPCVFIGLSLLSAWFKDWAYGFGCGA